MFAPKANPPVVRVMFDATLWGGIWNPKTQSVSFNQVDDFGAREEGMPLEMLQSDFRGAGVRCELNPIASF